MNLLTAFRSRGPAPEAPVVSERYSFTDWLSDLSAPYTHNGNQYTLPVQFTQTGKTQTPIPNEYLGIVGAFRGNSTLHSVVMTRARLFTEAQFIFKNQTTGKLFGTPELDILNAPWPNGTVGDLLMLGEISASFGGNFYLHRDVLDGRMRWLRPDWVSIILSSSLNPGNPAFAMDAEVVGYLFRPFNAPGDVKAEYLPASEVAHWTPIPDPIAPWRGMSWVSPIIRELMADSAATDHKLSFFEHGATPNLAIKLPESIVNKTQFEEIRDAMEESHAGSRNAWKTLYLAAGADVTMVGLDMAKIDFRNLQGAGEVRVATTAGVPASVVGFNEALKGSSLNTGNFSAARRLFADMWARPQWRSVCASLAKLVQVPGGAKLWYDDRDIAFLKEDQLDEANIQQVQASTIMQLINSGYDPDAAVDFVSSNDVTHLAGKHTGLVSVQLQPPNTMDPAEGDADSADADESTEPPDDERAEGLDFATALQRMTPGVGTVIDADEARTLLRNMGADIPETAPDEIANPPEPPAPVIAPGLPPHSPPAPPKPAAAPEDTPPPTKP